MDENGHIASWVGFEKLRDQLRAVAGDLKNTSEFLRQDNNSSVGEIKANINRSIRMGQILEYVIHLCTREHNIAPELVDEEIEAILG
jgi:hypothetical protein